MNELDWRLQRSPHYLGILIDNKNAESVRKVGAISSRHLGEMCGYSGEKTEAGVNKAPAFLLQRCWARAGLTEPSCLSAVDQRAGLI